MSSGNKNCVRCASQHYDIIEQVEACRQKARKARLESLNCLNKESVIALLIQHKLLWVSVIASSLLRSSENKQIAFAFLQ